MVTSDSRMKQVVDEAFAAIAGIPSEQDSDLRRIAFERVLDALLGDAVSNGAKATSTAAVPATAIDDGFATESQRTQAIAGYLRIAQEGASDLFDVSEIEPRLQVSSQKLASTKSQATKQITLLVAAARDALGLRTGTADIRTAVDDLRKYDKNNFTRTMQGIEEVALRGKPGSRNREIRLRLVGTEAARQIAQELVGTDGGQ